MEIIEKLIQGIVLATLFGVLFNFMFRHISKENFRKALVGLAQNNVTITVEMVVDLYLGAYEKSKSKLSTSDMKRLESAYLCTLVALVKETDPSKKITETMLLNMWSLASQIRIFNPKI